MTEKKQQGDVAFICALAELLEKNDLTELVVKREYGEDDGALNRQATLLLEQRFE